MPETLFHVRWPDGSRETCYSPSSIIEQHLETARAYPLAEFVAACRQGLQAARDRIGEGYGRHGCSRAIAQLAAIEAHAHRYTDDANAMVRVERFASYDRLRA